MRKVVKYELQDHLDEILKMKEEKMLNREIAEIFNTSRSSISRLLRSNGIFLRPEFKESDIEVVIDEYVNQKLPVTEIARKHHKETKYISNLLKEHGIPLQGSSVRNRIYSIDETFFDSINTQQKAYCLGFIFADGWVSHGKLSLRLQCGDKYILQEMLKLMGSNHPLYYIDYHNKYIINDGYQRQDQWGFTISSRRLCDGLAQYGVVENKSLIIHYSEKIPDQMFPHFLRGLFDGDGWACKDRNVFSLTGCKYLLSDIQKKLYDILGVEMQTYNAACNNGITKVLMTTNYKYTKAIYDYMYKDSVIHLKRKYQIYENRYLTN